MSIKEQLKRLNMEKPSSYKRIRETERDIVIEFLKENACLGAHKVIVEHDNIVTKILFYNQTIVDELRANGIDVYFESDYYTQEKECVIDWS